MDIIKKYEKQIIKQIKWKKVIKLPVIMVGLYLGH